jgi:hypothetical protein
LVGIERIGLDDAEVFGSGDEVFQFWSLYRVGLVLLAVVPLLLGLATAVTPLQVGASSIVFPRAAALAFWTWLVGAVVTVVGFLADGGLGTPDAGSQRQAVALFAIGRTGLVLRPVGHDDGDEVIIGMAFGFHRL